MTTADPSWIALAQLYFPIAGLIGLAFWSGVLSNRVRGLERAAETGGKGGERLAILETKMDLVSGQLIGIDSRLTDLAQNIALAQPPGYRPGVRRGPS